MSKSKLKSISQFKERGKVVLVRVDYNGETDGDRVLDDTRIRASLPTLKHLVGLQSRILLVSHRGRPNGIDPSLSLKPMARSLAELLSYKFVEMLPGRISFPSYPVPHVLFTDAKFTEFTKDKIQQGLRPGDILFFENIRFYDEEESLSKKFAQDLAALSDVFVNEAFSVCHHASTSTVLLPKILPSFAGLRLLEEISNIDFVVNSAKKPFVAVIGGAKISDKAAMLTNLLPKVDWLLVGGAISNLFLHALGYEIGKSKIEKEAILVVNEILRNYKEKLILPLDVIVATNIDSPGRAVGVKEVSKSEAILDLGPQTVLKFSEVIKSAATIMWNGPLGLFEKKQFSHASLSIARLIASRAKGKAFALVGGGETSQVLKATGMQQYIDYVSTGGGAMLAYLGREKMPGLEALKN